MISQYQFKEVVKTTSGLLVHGHGVGCIRDDIFQPLDSYRLSVLFLCCVN